MTIERLREILKMPLKSRPQLRLVSAELRSLDYREEHDPSVLWRWDRDSYGAFLIRDRKAEHIAIRRPDLMTWSSIIIDGHHEYWEEELIDAIDVIRGLR